jgi:hypothetical protein
VSPLSPRSRSGSPGVHWSSHYPPGHHHGPYYPEGAHYPGTPRFELITTEVTLT